MPELGKPFYANCVHLAGGCSIYADRPKRCSEFRCAWHLNYLGPRVDRRPDQCGVMFQLEAEERGNKWYIGIYELKAGAANTDKTAYLCDIILTSKLTRHLPWGSPALRIYPFGSDLPVNYPISDRFDCVPDYGTMSMRRTGGAWVFDGRIREQVLEPKK